MLAMPRGIITGGDGNTQGGANVRPHRLLRLQHDPRRGRRTRPTIVNPIEGRVEEADVQFIVDGTATATSGVQRVQLKVRDRDSGQYLQDNLTTWGARRTRSTSNLDRRPTRRRPTWSLPLTISGNRRIQLLRPDLRGQRHQRRHRKATQEDRDLRARRPDADHVHQRTVGSVIPTTTFTVTGTAPGRRRRQLHQRLVP